jgi:hypothetical protein
MGERPRGVRRCLCTGLLLASVLCVPAAGSAGTAPVLDQAAGARVKTVFDAERSRAGWGPFFTRASFQRAAEANASDLATSGNLTHLPPGMSTATGGAAISAPDAVAATAETIAHQLLQIASFRTSTRTLFLTDGGWGAVVTPANGGNVRVTVSVMLGIGPFARPTSSGCTNKSGYCWFGWGLNRHLPQLRNRIAWRISTPGATAYRIGVVKSAVAMINRVPGLGADMFYAGTTTHTSPTLRQPFVVHWMNTATHCLSAAAPACTFPRTYLGQYTGGTVRLRNGAFPQNRARRAEWVAVVAHEIGHALGLAHYNNVYAGSLQLMNGNQQAVLSPQLGDRHGLRAMAPPGALRAHLSLASAAASPGDDVAAVVTASSNGFGGVRRVRLQCTDPTGTFVTRSTRTGTFDILSRDYALDWQIAADVTPYTSSCRAVVESKAAKLVTATVPLTIS